MPDTLKAVEELTADNRHSAAMYLTARHFGFRDLCAVFRSVHKEHRTTHDLSDEANARRHEAFKEMRRRAVAQHGWEVWLGFKL